VSVIYAQHFQGAGGGALGFGPVAVGMVFMARGVPVTSYPSNPAPTPFATSYSAPTQLGTIGTTYSVTAVIPDPAANPNVPGASPGDQVTLSDGVGTIAASQLSQFYRVS